MTARTTANLNLRTGAGTDNPVITVIPNGAVVTVTGDPWYPVAVAGTSGWVSGAYLDLDAPGPALTPAQQRFATVAKQYLGRWYQWGGNGPDRFDCSGYTGYVLSELGFVARGWDYSANTQMHKFRDGAWPGVRVTGALLPGDLMFFGKDRATHVTFALGDGTLIGANGGNALTRTVADAQKRNAKVDIRPVDYRKDLIEVWRPGYLV